MQPSTDPADAPLDAARRFLAKHRGEHLERDDERLLARCAGHLSDLLALSERRAQSVAAQALADLKAKAAGGYIDANACTSYAVVVQDTAANTQHLVGVDELLALVRRRAPEPAPS